MKWIQKFEIFLLLWHRAALRKPWLCLFILVATTVLLAQGLSKIQFILSVEDMAGEKIHAADTFNEMREAFDESYPSTLLVSPAENRNSFSSEELCTLRDWFAHERNYHPTLKSSFMTFDLLKPYSKEPSHLEYKDYVPLECYKDVEGEEALTQEGLKNLLKGPWPLYKNAHGKDHLVFQLNFEPAENFRFGSFNANVLKEYRAKVEKELPALVPNIRLHWIGDADYQRYIQVGLDRAQILNLVMVVLLTILLGILFVSWRTGIIFTATIIISGIWLYGAKGWMHSPFDILSNLLFLMLGVSTLEDFTFVCQEQRKGYSVLTSVRKVLIPSFYTSLTTILGFISLNASSLEMIERLGQWAAVGALLEWIFIFILLPSIWNHFFKKTLWVGLGKDLISFNWLLKKKLPRPLARMGLLIFPFACFSVFHLKIQDAPEALFPDNHPYKQDLKYLREHQGWRGFVYLVFPSTTTEDEKKLVANRMTQPEYREVIAESESFTGIIDSLTKMYSEPDIRTIVEREFKSSGYGGVYFSKEKDLERMILYIPKLEMDFIFELEKKISELCNGESGKKLCYVTGKPIAFADFASKIAGTLYESLAMSLIMVFLLILLLAAYKKRLRSFGTIMASSIFGTSVMLVGMAAFQVPINFLTSVFLSVLVGLTGDNAIHYLYSAKNKALEKGVDERADASIVTSFIMAVSSLVFLGAVFDPPRTLGILLFLGILASLFGDLWVLVGLSDD